MTGHGGKEFLKFQDAEEISAFDLADAFAQMWEKKRYHEMLYMIDTCQANTMYTKFYSPNIIATGSSALDESSYSHHADNDVGVAVIDRYTYFNLDFLETQVQDQFSKLTLGDLFDSYDFDKIHSHPGFRYDLFPGGEHNARNRLVMDFFGNVRNVEVEGAATAWNESAWREDMVRLGKLIEEARRRHNISEESTLPENHDRIVAKQPKVLGSEHAAKVEMENAWSKQAIGASILVGCIAIWGLASWFDGPS
jgi:glycosylphosphatidylinositol transamidase (GPIT) subunit GPI8